MRIQILSFLTGLILASLFGGLHFLLLNSIKEKVVRKNFLAKLSYLVVTPLFILFLGIVSRHVNDYYKSLNQGAGLTPAGVVIGLVIYTAIIVPKFYKYFKQKGAYNVD